MSRTAAAPPATGAWRERFDVVEGLLPGAGSPFVRDLRRRAIERFVDLGFPSPRAEAWQSFDTRAIAATEFRSAAGGRLAREVERSLLGYLLPGQDLPRAVFVNGAFAPAVSHLGPMPAGVTATSLSAAFTAFPERLKSRFGTVATLGDDPFLALNTAFFGDGFFLHLPKGVVLDRPIQLVFLSEPGEAPSITHPRILVVAEEHSRATILKTYLGAGRGGYLTNSVTEIVALPGAQIEIVKVQEEGAEAFHLGTSRVHQERDSRVSAHVVMMGGKRARSEFSFRLAGEGASCALNGLFVGGDDQVLDNPTTIDHAAPRCTSRELYKGVLDGRARGAFTGRVIVRPGAQQTDAAQTNKNLLLSDDATIDTRPQLEIYADDVKCSHGATSGQMDQDALFYLRSRGIERDLARILLTRAFVDEIIDSIEIPSLRAHLHSRIDGRVAPGAILQEPV